MALEGSLAEVALADICQLLAMGQKTGCLRVADESNLGYVYFENGRVVHATVLGRPDRLGDLLVAGGILPRDELAKVVSNAEGGADRPLAEILRESAAVSDEDLESCLSMQVEEAIFNLFGWHHGTFHFNPDQTLDETRPKLSLNAEGLLLEGARRVDEWSQIEKKVPSLDVIFNAVSEPPADAESELTGAQRKILGLLDGERTVDDLMKASGLLEFDTCKALFGLLQAGFIERVGTRIAHDNGSSETEAKGHLQLARAFYKAGLLEDAERELNRSVDALDSFDPARRQLAVLLLRERRWAEALHQLDQVAGEDDGGYGLLRNRALALERVGRVDEALALLDEAERQFPEDPGLALLRGVFLARAKAPGPAREVFRLYRELAGDEAPPAVFFASAVLASALAGEIDEALGFGREGLRLYPTSGPLLVNVGAVLQRAGEVEAAGAYYLRALKSATPPPQAHKALGDLALERDDLAGARAHYERATKLDPELGDDVYLRLGDIARREDDPGYAQLLWRRALELNPDNAVARSHLDSLAAVTVDS